MPVITATVFRISSLKPFQFKAMAAAIEAAPATMSPMPRGKPPPLKAIMAPRANIAVPTIVVIRVNGALTSLTKPFQFRAKALAILTAPIAMRAIPRGTFAPVKANIAPTAREAPARIPVRVVRASVKGWSLLCQLMTAADTRLTAPRAMSAIPRGRFAPENAMIAPRASMKPPTIPVINASVFASSADMIPQLTTAVAPRPTAPATMSPNPRGILAPVKTNMAPTAKSAPETIAVISAREFSIMALISPTLIEIASPRKSYSGRSKSNPFPPPAPPAPPAPEAVSGENTFNSSNPAVYCFNFLAAPAASSRLVAISSAPAAPTERPE